MDTWTGALAAAGIAAAGFFMWKQHEANRDVYGWQQGDVIETDTGYLTIITPNHGADGWLEWYSYYNGWYRQGDPLISAGWITPQTLMARHAVRVAQLGIIVPVA